MKDFTHRFGCAMAHIREDVNEMSAADHGYLQDLKYRVQQLHSDGRIKAVFESLPEHACCLENPYLDNNQDYFLFLFFGKKEESTCLNLSKHLNNCYHCFEIFTQVLHSFYRRKQELTEYQKGRADDQ